MLPTTQQQRLATLHAPACQRYYASRLAAESPHPSTFDVPRGIYRPSTTGTKMLVKRAWTLEDVVADPDTFELVRHPSREPFTLPIWVRHGLRTSWPLSTIQPLELAAQFSRLTRGRFAQTRTAQRSVKAFVGPRAEWLAPAVWKSGTTTLNAALSRLTQKQLVEGSLLV